MLSLWVHLFLYIGVNGLLNIILLLFSPSPTFVQFNLKVI
jgi:hypothetical protein